MPNPNGPTTYLFTEKKICGILSEHIEHPITHQKGIITGVGLNVNLNTAQVATIDQPATSMLIETNTTHSLENTLDDLLPHLSFWFKQWQTDYFNAIRTTWEALTGPLGRPLNIRDGNHTQSGTLAGYGENGELLLKPIKVSNPSGAEKSPDEKKSLPLSHPAIDQRLCHYPSLCGSNRSTARTHDPHTYRLLQVRYLLRMETELALSTRLCLRTQQRQTQKSRHHLLRTRAVRGTIAADTRLFPYGTIIQIPGYGWGRVEDIGGAIKGRHIDLFFDSHQEALEWGRQKKQVLIWKPRR